MGDMSHKAHIGLTDIVTDVVKVRIPQEEEIKRTFRAFHLKKVEWCKADVFIKHIFERKNAWLVRLAFLVKVGYVDKWGDKQEFRRLVFFDKWECFPPDCKRCDWLKPRVEVDKICCDASEIDDGHCRDNLKVRLRFVIIIKGLKREEVTVITPHDPKDDSKDDFSGDCSDSGKHDKKRDRKDDRKRDDKHDRKRDCKDDRKHDDRHDRKRDCKDDRKHDDRHDRKRDCKDDRKHDDRHDRDRRRYYRREDY